MLVHLQGINYAADSAPNDELRCRGGCSGGGGREMSPATFFAILAVPLGGCMERIDPEE